MFTQSGTPRQGNAKSPPREDDNGLLTLRAVVVLGAAGLIGLALGAGAGVAAAIPVTGAISPTAGTILGVIVGLGAAALWCLMAAKTLNDLIRR